MGKKNQQDAVDSKVFVDPFRVDGMKAFHLASCKTAERGGIDKDGGQEIIKANRDRLSDLQEKLYAQDRWSLLLIFQGMDAAGKDSAIESVFDGVNPQGCDVHSFKQPSTEELDHDFMWRAARRLPERGRIGIFNRSYYEEVLVVRVHPEILAKQKIPPRLVTKTIWRERFEDISAFEKYLAHNGTVVLKFFLNVSKEEQRQRFLERLEEPAKNWKFSMGDVAERKLWDMYQAAYQDMIRHTASLHAPWHVVPADHKWFARVVIGSTIVSTLDKLDLHFPKVDKSELSEFNKVRKALESEGRSAAGSKKVAVKNSATGKSEAVSASSPSRRPRGPQPRK
ncbi:polyphosphate kinase 2 family protein [Nitrobacter sp. JJSN]|uniref:polyphosphate kinase 2 family protein n=1 Tax=Nitrobacter sp. JJSN TaxID=3453033 RepID=UPI003F772B5A